MHNRRSFLKKLVFGSIGLAIAPEILADTPNVISRESKKREPKLLILTGTRGYGRSTYYQRLWQQQMSKNMLANG